MNPKIFISYNSNDQSFARKIANELKGAGAYVWIDEGNLKIGDSLLSTITKSIYDVDFLIVILSPNSIKSNWVQSELEIAMTLEIDSNKKIKVLPILYQNCDIPIYLKHKLYGDFRDSQQYGSNIISLLHSVGLPTKTRLFNDRNFGLKILKRKQILDIQDINGHIVKFHERTKFLVLEDNVTTYLDTLDANFRNLQIDNATVLTQYKEEHVWHIESKFNSVHQKEEVFIRNFSCEFIDLFDEPESYWTRHPSDEAELLHTIIRFPKNRPPQKFFTVEKFSQYDAPCEFLAYKKKFGNRIQLVWKLEKANPNSKYKIEWVW